MKSPLQMLGGCRETRQGKERRSKYRGPDCASLTALERINFFKTKIRFNKYFPVKAQLTNPLAFDSALFLRLSFPPQQYLSFLCFSREAHLAGPPGSEHRLPKEDPSLLSTGSAQRG